MFIYTHGTAGSNSKTHIRLFCDCLMGRRCWRSGCGSLTWGIPPRLSVRFHIPYRSFKNECSVRGKKHHHNGSRIGQRTRPTTISLTAQEDDFNIAEGLPNVTHVKHRWTQHIRQLSSSLETKCCWFSSRGSNTRRPEIDSKDKREGACKRDGRNLSVEFSESRTQIKEKSNRKNQRTGRQKDGIWRADSPPTESWSELIEMWSGCRGTSKRKDEGS